MAEGCSQSSSRRFIVVLYGAWGRIRRGRSNHGSSWGVTGRAGSGGTAFYRRTVADTKPPRLAATGAKIPVASPPPMPFAAVPRARPTPGRAWYDPPARVDKRLGAIDHQVAAPANGMDGCRR